MDVCVYFIVCLCRQGSREAVIWMAVHHKQKKALELFAREVAPAGTGMGTKKHNTQYFGSFTSKVYEIDG